mmetsp:Transcript_2113/g.5536  ORF Transcript_2113/g.5536 Transcript_2113/m.5536 type:complete len:456 (+) Transcript_2113:329-1696(+)
MHQAQGRRRPLRRRGCRHHADLQGPRLRDIHARPHVGLRGRLAGRAALVDQLPQDDAQRHPGAQEAAADAGGRDDPQGGLGRPQGREHRRRGRVGGPLVCAQLVRRAACLPGRRVDRGAARRARRPQARRARRALQGHGLLRLLHRPHRRREDNAHAPDRPRRHAGVARRAADAAVGVHHADQQGRAHHDAAPGLARKEGREGGDGRGVEEAVLRPLGAPGAAGRRARGAALPALLQVGGPGGGRLRGWRHRPGRRRRDPQARRQGAAHRHRDAAVAAARRLVQHAGHVDREAPAGLLGRRDAGRGRGAQGGAAAGGRRDDRRGGDEDAGAGARRAGVLEDGQVRAAVGRRAALEVGRGLAVGRGGDRHQEGARRVAARAARLAAARHHPAGAPMDARGRQRRGAAEVGEAARGRRSREARLRDPQRLDGEEGQHGRRLEAALLRAAVDARAALL